MRCILLTSALILMCVLTFPGIAQTTQSTVSMNGAWHFLPDNAHLSPTLPSEGAQWQTIQVPGIWDDFGVLRCWYRRSVTAPADWRGSRIKLNFGAVAFRAEVYVNGTHCGGHLGGHTPFSVDITDAVRFGAENVIAVWVEGWTATLRADIDRTNIKMLADAPDNSMVMTFGSLLHESVHRRGIWQGVTLQAVNPVHVTDVFVMASHTGQYTAIITVANENKAPFTGSLTHNITPWNNTDAARFLGTPIAIAVSPGEVKEFIVSGVMPKARPWYPDQPNLYVFTTQLVAGEKVLDARPTRFGFRTIEVKNGNYRLNGQRVNFRCYGNGMTIPWKWSWRADGTTPEYRKAFLDQHLGNSNIYRTHCVPVEPDFYDYAAEKGMMIIAEGENAFRYKYDIKNPAFWENSRRLLAERIRRDRNNPAIVMWSMENEMCISYITDGIFFPEGLQSLAQTAKALDPTRPIEFEGDGGWPFKSVANPSDTLNMHLYDETVAQIQRPEVSRGNLTNLPEAFYWPERVSAPGSFSWWLATENGLPSDRPFYIGEYGAFVYNPIHEYASWGGEAIYRNLFLDGNGIFTTAGERLRMQNEAHRACQVDGISPWVDGAVNAHTKVMFDAVEESFRPVKAIVRELDRRFYAGETMMRTITVFNDQYRPRPLTLTWSLVQGKTVMKCQTTALKSIPGELERVTVQYRFPSVSKPLPVTFRLVVKNGADVLYSTDLPYTVYPRVPLRMSPKVMVCDPAGTLAQAGIQANVVDSVAKGLALNATTLLVMPEAHTNSFVNSAEAGLLLAAVEHGTTVIFLRPQGSLRWISPELARNEQLLTPKAFIRAAGHPIFNGLTDADFAMWRGDNLVSKEDLIRPTTADALTLVECGGEKGLRYSPLVEIRRGKGRLLLCQMFVAEKLTSEPVAGKLLQNMLDYAASIPTEATAPLQVIAGTDQASLTAFTQGGIAHRVVELTQATTGTFYAGGDAAIATLASSSDAARRFVEQGGTLILHGATSAAQPSFDALLPVKVSLVARQIQHEQLEKTADSPLLAGMNLTDLFWFDAQQFGEHPTQRRIVDTVLQVTDANAQILLREPKATQGLWSGYNLQHLSAAVGNAPHIAQPGAALVRIPYGNGFFLIDQVRWAEEYETYENARRYIGVLFYNLDVATTAPVRVNVTACNPDFLRAALDAKTYVKSDQTPMWAAGDAAGFSLAALPEGRYRLLVSARGTLPNGGEVVTVRFGGKPLGQIKMTSPNPTLYELPQRIEVGPTRDRLLEFSYAGMAVTDFTLIKEA